jgi:hypothetical protein
MSCAGNEDVRNLGAYFASLPPPKASAPDDSPDLSAIRNIVLKW